MAQQPGQIFGVNADGTEQPYEYRTPLQQNNYFWKTLQITSPDDAIDERDYDEYNEAVGDDVYDREEFMEFADFSKMVDLTETGANPTVEMKAQTIVDQIMNNTNISEEERSTVLETAHFNYDTWQTGNNGLIYTNNDIVEGIQQRKYEAKNQVIPVSQSIIDAQWIDHLNHRTKEDKDHRVPALAELRNQDIQLQTNRINFHDQAFDTEWAGWIQQGYVQNPNMVTDDLNHYQLTGLSDQFFTYERNLRDMYAMDKFKNAKSTEEAESWKKAINPDRLNTMIKYMKDRYADEKKE